MSEYDEIQVSEWLRDGIAAVKAGRRDEARALLMRVVEVNESSEQAWLWLSGVVDADEERLICLENVLTLNPDNAQARAGLRWLQERVQSPQQSERGEEREREPELFMTPDGCAYCGLSADENDWHCPHCGGQLTSMQFKREQRSSTARLLPLFWSVLAAVNLIEFFLIGLLWGNVEEALSLPQAYHTYIAGPVVTGASNLDTLFAADQWVQIVRFTLFGLAVLEGLLALALSWRRPRAYTLALTLIALQLVIGVLLFTLGFSGYFAAIFRGIFTLALTVFLLQTSEDFSKEKRREWLELDRFVVNDVDCYTRGHAYAKRGMWAKALLHWQKAVALSAERAKDTYFAALARAYAHLRRYEMALRYADEAMHVSREPQNWQPLREAIVQAQRRAAGHDGEEAL